MNKIVRARCLLSIGCVVLVALAIVSHVYYWYWPRLRATAPGESSLASSILMSGKSASLALWIPFPHQNLGALARSSDSSPEVIRALARLVNLPSPQLPAFGPFVFPPASEVVVEASSDGAAVRISARVYPVVGWLARTSGWLAGNPWLKGGEVVVAQRSVWVAWTDGIWSASTSGAFPDFGHTNLSQDCQEVEALGRESLASLWLDDRFDPLPSGNYRLEQLEESFHIVLGEMNSIGTSPWIQGIENLETPIVVLANESGSGSLEQNVLILTGKSSIVVPEFPAAAVLHRGGGLGWKLPGEGILSFLGLDRIILDQGPWVAKSIDPSTAKSGLGLLPQIVELQKEVLGRRLRLGAWIDLGIAADVVDGLSRATEGLPKMVRGDLQRWIDIFEVVGAFRKVESISLQIIEGPELVELRFHLLNEA